MGIRAFFSVNSPLFPFLPQYVYRHKRCQSLEIFLTILAQQDYESNNFEPFEISIDCIGCFKRDGGDIWWAGLGESKPLLKLQLELSDELIAAGFDMDKRAYSPHITIGRRVSTGMKPRCINPIKEQVSRVDLMKSERIKGKLTYTPIFTRKCLSETGR